MTNHMAQGAATSMEDGAFLGRLLGAVMAGKFSLADAVGIYEKVRMPKADYKQQVSFINGAIWMIPDGPIQKVSERRGPRRREGAATSGLTKTTAGARRGDVAGVEGRAVHPLLEPVRRPGDGDEVGVSRGGACGRKRR